MPRGENLHCMFRTSAKRYTNRPPANCKAARAAWDFHVLEGVKSGRGPVLWLQLLDGHWGAMFQNGELHEVENTGL